MKKILTVAALLLSTSIGTAAFAQGVPTIDTKNTLQTIKQLEVLLEDVGIQGDLLNKATEQLTKLQEQLDQLNGLRSKLEGVRSIVDMAMGDGLDSILNGNLHNVISTFKGVSKGDLSGFTDGKSSAMSASVTSVLESAGLPQSTVTAMANSGVPGAERTAAQAASGAVLAATAEQTYKETGVAMQRVEKLVIMSKESTDMKEAVDLNTRMLAELATLLARNLEMSAVAGAYTGQAGVMEAAAIAQERAYMTFSND